MIADSEDEGRGHETREMQVAPGKVKEADSPLEPPKNIHLDFG